MLKFLCVDIHELLTSDLLHQAIKGAFKDHLIEWVEDFLTAVHGSLKAQTILDEVDRCQGHSSLDTPSELNLPQRIPSLFETPLVPQAEG